jgi:hypothetical protein
MSKHKAKKPSRAETNKKIRNIMTKHGVDLAECQISATSTQVSLGGWLVRHDGSELAFPQVKALTDDLMNECGYVTTQLGNWDLTGGQIKKLENKNQDASAPEEQEAKKAS